MRLARGGDRQKMIAYPVSHVSAFTYLDHQLSRDAPFRGRNRGHAIWCRQRRGDHGALSCDRRLRWLSACAPLRAEGHPTLAIARLLRDLGSAADELRRSKSPAARGSRRLRSSSPASARPRGAGARLGLGVKTINAESAGELARIDEIARALGTEARAAPRESDIDALSHPHISTGLRGTVRRPARRCGANSP